MKKMAFFLVAAVLATTTALAGKALLDQNYRRLAGKEVVNLQTEYAGNVLLVVNTASKCGFTPQYKDQGFDVLGFPSNDFLGQEPGNEKQIQDFCTLTYGVKFPMFEKVHVRGNDATPFYKELKAATGDGPAWNFHKYLIDRNGNVVASFGSRTKPTDPALVAKVESLLAAPRPA